MPFSSTASCRPSPIGGTPSNGFDDKMPRMRLRALPANLIGVIVVIASFVALTALSLVFIRSERERNRLLAQYEAERIATGIFVIVAQAATGEVVDETLATPIIRAATLIT